jgi:hypothetical protein
VDEFDDSGQHRVADRLVGEGPDPNETLGREFRQLIVS